MPVIEFLTDLIDSKILAQSAINTLCTVYLCNAIITKVSTTEIEPTEIEPTGIFPRKAFAPCA